VCSCTLKYTGSGVFRASQLGGGVCVQSKGEEPARITLNFESVHQILIG